MEELVRRTTQLLLTTAALLQHLGNIEVPRNVPPVLLEKMYDVKQAQAKVLAAIRSLPQQEGGQ